MAIYTPRSYGSRKPERFIFSRYESIDTDAMTPPITPTTPLSPKEYDIVSLTKDDKEDVLKFLRVFFFKDEPLNKYLDLINEQAPRCQDLEGFSVKDLDENLSLKAVHNGKTIGLSLNSLLKRGYLDEDDGEVTDLKFGKIARLLDRVARESDVFARFPDCDKAVTVKILSVDGAYRGQGIAKELINRTREIAREIGAGFMTVDCTSHFSALAVRKLGFQLHYTLKYSEHKENGEVVFKPEPPHDACTVYVQKI